MKRRRATTTHDLMPDPAMTEAARLARIAAAEESAGRDADMLAEHMKKLEKLEDTIKSAPPVR